MVPAVLNVLLLTGILQASYSAREVPLSSPLAHLEDGGAGTGTHGFAGSRAAVYPFERSHSQKHEVGSPATMPLLQKRAPRGKKVLEQGWQAWQPAR